MTQTQPSPPTPSTRKVQVLTLSETDALVLEVITLGKQNLQLEESLLLKARQEWHQRQAEVIKQEQEFTAKIGKLVGIDVVDSLQLLDKATRSCRVEGQAAPEKPDTQEAT